MRCGFYFSLVFVGVFGKEPKMLTYVTLAAMFQQFEDLAVDKPMLETLSFEELGSRWRFTARISVENAVKASSDRDPRKRLLATRVLFVATRRIVTGVEPVIEALVALTQDRDPEIRNVARRALKKWSNQPAVFYCLAAHEEGRGKLRLWGSATARIALGTPSARLAEGWKNLLHREDRERSPTKKR